MSVRHNLTMDNQDLESNLRLLFFANANAQGYLDQHKFCHLCSSLLINADKADRIFHQLDRNGNGRISLEDFAHRFIQVMDGDNLLKYQVKRVCSSWTANGQWQGANDSAALIPTTQTGASKTTHDNSISADLLIPKHNSTIMNPLENWWNAALTSKSPLKTDYGEVRQGLEYTKKKVNADRSLETSKCHSENSECNQIDQSMETANQQTESPWAENTCQLTDKDMEALAKRNAQLVRPTTPITVYCKVHLAYHTLMEIDWSPNQSTSETSLPLTDTAQSEQADDYTGQDKWTGPIKRLIVNTQKLLEENRKLLVHLIRLHIKQGNSYSRSNPEEAVLKANEFKRLEEQGNYLAYYLQMMRSIIEKIEEMTITNEEAFEGFRTRVKQSRNESLALKEMVCRLKDSLVYFTKNQNRMHHLEQRTARNHEFKRELLKSFAQQRTLFKDLLEEDEEEEKEEGGEIICFKETNGRVEKLAEVEEDKTATSQVQWLPDEALVPPRALHRFHRQHSFM